MLRDSRCSALLLLRGDQASDFPVQLHLRQDGAHSAVNGCEKVGVVDVFSYVHGFLLSGALRLIGVNLRYLLQRKEKRGNFCRAFLRVAGISGSIPAQLQVLRGSRF